jgi:hypothetical protein
MISCVKNGKIVYDKDKKKLKLHPFLKKIAYV